MSQIFIMTALILFLCILANRFSGRFGMPALILFMAIGMFFGSDGLVKIPFDNYDLTNRICTVALSFIMFYGGFNTKWKSAKPIAIKAILLSTLGVLITAAVAMVFCYLALGFSFGESFLVGAVLGSTDAASVFSILRKEKLNLKNGVASLLEMESGSNDPVAYMLTAVGISIVNNDSSLNIPFAVFTQLTFGILIGCIIAAVGIFIFTKTKLVTEGVDTIFMIALVLICHGICSVLGGNEFLSVYILGILIGNYNIKNKTIMIHFFDGLTSLGQICIFFLLGLLSFPRQIPSVFITALLIALFLTLIARPVAVFMLLLPFKCSIRQCLLVSWAGLRGAASIVFSIMVIASCKDISHDLFHIVFVVSLLSVSIQGTLLPFMAKKLNMVDESIDVRKTFNDYQDESSITLMRMYIPKGHNWENKVISSVNMPTGSLAIMIKRHSDTIIPKGDTVILAEDSIILSVPSYNPDEDEKLEEIFITKEHTWCDQEIQDLNLPDHVLITLIKREDENLIPSGSTKILKNDIVVLFR